MKQRDLEELLRQMKDGDNSGLNSIFITHARYCISGLMKKHNCPREDAEDIYADSVLNLRDKLIDGRIEYLTDVKSYLFATCNNMFLARLKRTSRVMRAVSELSIGNDDIEADGETESQYREELINSVEVALNNLQEKCRNMLHMFYFEKLSLEEIAVRFDMANANVAKVSKARCFQRLINEVKLIRERKTTRTNAD